jgi:hypothetical protein
MQRVLQIIVILTVMSAVSVAQQNQGYFKAGSKALLFEFSGLADLGAGSYNGGLGGKYFLTDKMAVRGSLQFLSLSQEIPYQGDGGIDGSRDISLYGISGAVEVHFDTSRVNPYFGGGVGFAVSSTERKTAAADITQQLTIKNDIDGEAGYYGGTSLTIFAMLGVEVFIIDRLSLAAEYRLGYSYISQKDQEVTQGTTTVTTRQGSINGLRLESAGALILSVYF